MSVSSFSIACFSGLILCAAGCAGRFDPAHFEGSREPRRAEPESVSDVAVPTVDLEILGRVRAECRSQPGFRRLEGELLSDVDCSTDRLLSALRESAAQAGGELLVGAECGSEHRGSGNVDELQCRAEVARYRSGLHAHPGPLSVPRSVAASRPAPSASEVRRIDEPEASLSFRISLNFRPLLSRFERPALSRDQVRELARLPISDQPLGDLMASCEGACEERALRYGVLIAAGRLGARDVVDVRCYETGSGDACTGTLAAPDRTE